MDHKIKSLIFSKEHGSWALTFEPLTLALLVAPNMNGLILFLGAAFAFFAHPSARVLLTEKTNRSLPLRVFLSMALPAIVFLGLFIYLTNWPVSLPLLLAILLMVIYLILELLSLGRALYTELLASVSMGLIALSMVLSGGWPWIPALGFLLLIYSRSLGTTVYIHYRLVLLKKRSANIMPGIVILLLDGLLLLFLMLKGYIPVLGFLAGIILIVRAFWNLSPLMKKTTVRKLGFAEVFYGLLFMALTALGYWAGI